MLIAVWSDVQQGIIDTAIDQLIKHLHSLGMCLCKFWTFGTSFVNKLLQTISIFSCVFGSSGFCPWCQIFTVLMLDMVDRPTLLNCKALSLLKIVNEQKVKC